MKDRRCLLCLLLMVAGFALATTLQADSIHQAIVPPQQKVEGLTYEQWSAKWWQFAFGIPAAQNPLLAEQDYNCQIGQSGNVWFLTGVWGPPPIIRTRTCTMPAGKYIFFPVANNVYDNSIALPDGNLDWTDYSTEYMRKELAAQMNKVVGLTCKIDGQYVPFIHSAIYRVQAPVFHYWLPPGNIFGLNVPTPPGKLGIPGVVADGVYLMLKPLSPGSHVIQFTASFGTAPDAYRFDITYVIQVLP